MAFFYYTSKLSIKNGKKISRKKTNRGDKDCIRILVGEIGNALFYFRENLQNLGNLTLGQSDREMYLLNQCEIQKKTIDSILTTYLDLNELCIPNQAGGRPRNKHWNDALFLISEHHKSTGKLLTAKNLSAAVTQKFYPLDSQHVNLNGDTPLPIRIAGEIIRKYKKNLIEN